MGSVAKRPVTSSIGAVVFAKPSTNVDELIHAADSLMYRAKAEGKDRLLIADGASLRPAKASAQTAGEAARQAIGH